MNMVRMILKEAGGRIENAAGSIDSKDNMFAGSSGNAVSDKVGKMLGMSGNSNPIANPDSKDDSQVQTDTTIPTETEQPEVETDTTLDTDIETFSDERLKDTYSEYKAKNPQSKGNKGMLKNLDLDPMSSKAVTDNNSGGNMGAMANMFQGLMGSSGEGSDMGDSADMGADMGDMADGADMASDERLKHIFGDNQDAIQAFAKINAIKFTYNDTAKDIPGSEERGVDDDVHYGIKAQEIAENPFTESAVKKDPISDYLTIDIKELTTANTAIISEICKRILIIEKVLGIKVV